MLLAQPGDVAYPLLSFTQLLVQRPNFCKVLARDLIVGSSTFSDKALTMLLIEVYPCCTRLTMASLRTAC